MIVLAFQHELKATFRSVGRLGVLIAFIVASAYAITAGQQFVHQWIDALSAANDEQAEVVKSARGWLERGEKGPADRPWVDITQPLWQDWYAGTRLQRTPGRLAGIAAGAVDESPVVMRVHRLANPFDSSGIRLENPETDSTQAIDLVFVFVTLIPIVVIVMGTGIGGFEREHGMERLISTQAGHASRWFLARALAVTSITVLAVLGVCVATIVVTGAPVGDGVRLVALACLYTLLWGGALVLFSSTSKTVQGGAFAYGLMWAAVCILIPALLAERALSQASAEYEVENSLGARTERYEAYDLEIEEVLVQLYGEFPSLSSLPAAQLAKLPPTVSRHAYDGVVLLSLKERHGHRRDLELRSEASLLRSAWLSPAIALSHGFEQLAGNGSAATSEFRDQAMVSIRERLAWLLDKTWNQQALGAEEFESLVAVPARFTPQPASITPHLLILSVWVVIVWIAGVIRLRRSEQAPLP